MTARKVFYALAIGGFFIILFASLLGLHTRYVLWLWLLYVVVGIRDLRSTKNLQRNYPVIAHLRYVFESIRPEIQQYFIQTNLSGRPYSRQQRTIVYRRAKNLDDTHPFGTERDIEHPGYHFAQHSLAVKQPEQGADRWRIGNKDCYQPYYSSIINISGMSFGALGDTAVEALNMGAQLGGFAQNTGEGGLTEFHLKHGGDLIWQIGTGYFGCRTVQGDFDVEAFRQKAKKDVVKMVEIKLSQGAKPSHGGVLPAAKVTPLIASIRGIPPGVDCISPPTHSTFSTPLGLIEYVQLLRENAVGKPVGFKLCIGRREEFMAIVKAMLKLSIYPDFITIDGAEGGTGASPFEYSDSLGTPLNEGLAFVHNVLTGVGIREKITLIASGKILTGFDVVMKMALGANICHLARPMMFSLGCIQALRCNTGTCPTGVATQDPKRTKAIVVPHKAEHVRNYHHNTIQSVLNLMASMGVSSPQDLSANMIYHRFSEHHSETLHKVYEYLQPGDILSRSASFERYLRYWDAANADSF